MTLSAELRSVTDWTFPSNMALCGFEGARCDKSLL